ncbi:MAG: NIPSNAP family protein [Verrucomicrobiota bacterium]
MNRRDFLTGSVAASTLAALSAPAAEQKSTQEYYQLRVYRLKPDADTSLLNQYLEKAAIPALNRIGIKPVGVFNETDAKADPAVYVLVPYPSFEMIATIPARLRADADYMSAGADYLQTPKSKPAYLRIDTWLLRAFAGIPKIELPSFSKEKKERIFELRTYESYSETKAQKKVDMFNDGEIQLMREVGLNPIFFGQALIGANLPHLTYMLSAETREAHKQHFDTFGKHPKWKEMSSDPQYADTVSKISNHFLAPAPFSQI